MDIMSVVQKHQENKGENINIVEITFICKQCGNTETRIEYLYNTNKLTKQKNIRY
jgi:hypothetical protein